jgi:hypothetical protein
MVSPIERPIAIGAYGGSMPSPALTAWSTSSAAALSQLQAHRAVSGVRTARGKNTLQLNYAYVLLLAAHFQAYCRSLHSDSTQRLVEASDPVTAAVLATNLSFGRQLDHGNAQPSALGADFGRLRLEFWAVVKAADTRNTARQRKLEELNDWRNAIAHHDIERHRADLNPHTVTLAACNTWHSALNGLAESFDRVLADHLERLLGTRPW